MSFRARVQDNFGEIFLHTRSPWDLRGEQRFTKGTLWQTNHLVIIGGSLPGTSEDTIDIGKQGPNKMPTGLLMKEMEKYLEGAEHL